MEDLIENHGEALLARMKKIIYYSPSLNTITSQMRRDKNSFFSIVNTFHIFIRRKEIKQVTKKLLSLINNIEFRACN